MGSASCKNPNSTKQEKETNKKITIGVFGLDNAGKTSAVKAIEGAPTDHVDPTVGFQTTKVTYPSTAKNDNKSQERITIIDVSGSRNYRQRSWSDHYKQIHGLIFVLDASEKKRLTENKDILDDLLEHDDLKDKPILILANKQDRRGAIKKEDDIKEKLNIEELKRKHKIELCQATPTANNKTDESIRKGFSWLIRMIDDNYETLNARVKNPKSLITPKPVERKSYANNKRKPDKSGQSDNDDDIVYAGKRVTTTTTPPIHRKPFDSRSIINSSKLPELDLKKTKPKTSGHETYDESDEDQPRASSRPNIIRPDNESNTRLQANLTSATGLNKKNKLTGGTNKDNDTSSKKSHDNEPKSFRSTYESFPEDTPWSSSARKPTKFDETPFRMNTKSSLTTDLTKRTISPLVHDTKFYTNNSLSKRDDDSDDENKNTLNRTPNLRSTMNKPLTNTKTPTLGIYGADYDEYEDKNKDSFNKSFQRLPDRSNLNNGYRGTISRPPSSPSLANSRSKTAEDNDLPSSLPLLSKSSSRPNLNRDDVLSTFSKPSTTTKRFDSHDDDDDDRFKSLVKQPLRSRPLTGNDRDRPLSVSKINTNSKYSDDDNKSSSKPLTRSKYDDDNELPSSTSKFGARSKYGDISRPLSPLRLSSTRSKKDDDDEEVSSKPAGRYSSTNIRRPSPSPSPPLKSGSRSKYDDDDDDLRSKPTMRSTFKSNSPSPPPSKPNNRSKFEDDDDDDLRSKPAVRSNFKSNNRTSSPSPPPRASSRWKDDDDDDDDDDDKYGSKSKITARTNMKSNSRSSPSPPRSKYEDDDDDDLRSKPGARSNFKSNSRSSPSPPPYSKSNTRWKSTDDDDRPSSVKKSTAQSKFEDDDDYSPSYKRNNSSSRDDDYNGSNNARSRFAKDDFNSSRGGYNSTRIRSNS